jgi:hypothetical protein
LGDEFNLKFTREELAFEFLVFANIGRRRAGDALGAEQDSQTPVVNAAVVAYHPQVSDSGGVDSRNELAGDSTEPKSANS